MRARPPEEIMGGGEPLFSCLAFFNTYSLPFSLFNPAATRESQAPMRGDPALKKHEWDAYFLKIARAVGENSKCLSRQIGAILVRDKSIISTGYNGPPRGVPHCSQRYACDTHLIRHLRDVHGSREFDTTLCPRRLLGYASGEGLNFCIASHAEVNCINNAARQGICTRGSTMFLSCDILPCKNCLCEIINAGIEEVVVLEYQPYDQTSLFLIEHSGLRIRTYDLGEAA